MGVSVISTSTANAVAANSAVSSTGTSASEGLPGDFAALLFGEIQSLLAPAAAKSEKSTSTVDLDEAAKLAALEDPEASASIVDPAVMAALLGNVQVAPTPPNSGREAFPPLVKPSEKQLSNVTSAIIGKDAKSASLIPDSDKSKTLLADTEKAFVAPSLANSTAQGARSEAANIAVEAKITDAASAAMANAANTLATGRQSVEATSAPRQANIDTPLHASSWPQQFSEKIVWLAKNDQQSAQININPPQLGPIQITVNLSGDQATLAFASPHAEVRQAIENALPQLKEMLSTAGINLGQSNVGANLSQQTPDNPFHAANGNRSANENAILPANDKAANIASSQVLHRGRGLVDLFA